MPLFQEDQGSNSSRLHTLYKVILVAMSKQYLIVEADLLLGKKAPVFSFYFRRLPTKLVRIARAAET